VTAGYSGTPLPKKLGIKEGHSVATVGAPPSFASLLGPLPAGVRLDADPRGGGPFDVIVAFALSEPEVRTRFDRARSRLRVDGGLWICWPKRSSPMATELAERHVRAYGLSTGLVDNKICAIDDDWSGLRFVVRRADRPLRRSR
jgi:hypothetical protein